MNYFEQRQHDKIFGKAPEPKKVYRIPAKSAKKIAAEAAAKKEAEKVSLELNKKVEDLALKAQESEAKLTAERTKNDAMASRLAELEKKNQTHLMAQRVDGLIRDGKVLPAQKDTVVSLYMDGLGVEVEFEGKKISLADKLYAMDQKREKIVSFGQLAQGNAGGASSVPEVQELGELTRGYFMGEINEEEFKTAKKLWNDRAKTAGEVIPDKRAQEIEL